MVGHWKAAIEIQADNLNFKPFAVSLVDLVNMH